MTFEIADPNPLSIVMQLKRAWYRVIPYQTNQRSPGDPLHGIFRYIIGCESLVILN